MNVIDLTHVGEVLLAELLSKNPDIVKKILGIEREIEKDDYRVLPEISLAPVTINQQEYPFDGMSRIDVGIIYPNQGEERICHPIELKLGTDLLGNCKSGIGRFTQGYHTTHNSTRIGGSMISILGNKPSDNNMTFQRNDICVADERVNQKKEKIVVSDRWTLIVRTEKIANVLNEQNGFFISESKIEHCHVLSFEELFDGMTVNNTMRELLPADGNFYEYWGLNNQNRSN